MIEAPRIKVGIDYDGVIVKKATSWDIPRRASKMGLPTLPGALESMRLLNTQPDVDMLGVYTVRPEWLRKKQTDRQIRRRGIPVERVTHTTNSPKAKIEELLLDATGIFEDNLTLYTALERIRHTDGIRQIVLIDDSVSKIVQAAIDLIEEKDYLRPLLEKFTLAAFNPKQPEELKGMIVPGVIHVVGMKNWSGVEGMLQEVRRR